jgi:hypothetical protein
MLPYEEYKNMLVKGMTWASTTLRYDSKERPLQCLMVPL